MVTGVQLKFSPFIETKRESSRAHKFLILVKFTETIGEPSVVGRKNTVNSVQIEFFDIYLQPALFVVCSVVEQDFEGHGDWKRSARPH